MFSVYILFSEKLQKFYTGQTQNLDNRLKEHNSKETKSIINGIPWKLIWTTHVENRILAVQLERKIKNYGAKRFLSEVVMLGNLP